MQAIVVDEPGGPEVLRLAELPLPEPGPGEVRVRLGAIGVNFADVLCRQGRHPGMRQPPIVPGCEAAGVVDALGPGATRLSLGTRVGVYTPFGGAYAQALVVPDDYALALPDAMPFDDAAAFTHLALTAWAAFDRLGNAPPPAATVLVTAAAGGLGGMLLQLAAARGWRTIAAVGSAGKREALTARGIAPVVDYAQGELTAQVHAATGGAGVDVVIDTVGGAVYAQAEAALAPLGRIVIAGMASGAAPVPNVSVLLARSAGCTTLNLAAIYARQPQRLQQAWTELCALYLDGRLTPRISARLPLSAVAVAHRALESRSSVDKLMLDPHGGASAAVSPDTSFGTLLGTSLA